VVHEVYFRTVFTTTRVITLVGMAALIAEHLGSPLGFTPGDLLRHVPVPPAAGLGVPPLAHHRAGRVAAEPAETTLLLPRRPSGTSQDCSWCLLGRRWSLSLALLWGVLGELIAGIVLGSRLRLGDPLSPA
jgi:hypothetical protein